MHGYYAPTSPYYAPSTPPLRSIGNQLMAQTFSPPTPMSFYHQTPPPQLQPPVTYVPNYGSPMQPVPSYVGWSPLQQPQPMHICYPSTSYTVPYPIQMVLEAPVQNRRSIRTVSHDRILSGGAKENCTVANKPKKNFDYRDLTLHDLHPHIIRFKLTRAELEKNAYPLFKSNNKVVEIAETTYTANKKMFLDDHDNKRVCSRCSKEFRMNDNGTMIHEKDICRYHNRAIVREGKKQTFSKRWQCCNEEVSTNVPGCKFSDIHVFDQLFKSELGRFIPTPAPSSPTDSRSTNAFALDCEMVYTLRGPALARLTMVDMKGKQVLDVFIKPPSEVIDANTEFSGLTMEQVESAKDTLQTCHKKLFKYVNSETILIGHSLESDLKAMRIVHTSVIDTAIMFSGADHKKALKKLSSLYLGKSIQGDNEDAVGHDSLEDAMTCVNLIYHGLKNPETVPHRSSS